MRKLLTIILVIAVILSCDQFFDQDDKKDFYPLADKNVWVYDGDDGEQTWTEAYLIDGTTTHYNGYTVYIEEAYIDGEHQAGYNSYLHQDDSGLYIYYFLDTDTYFQLLKFPLNLYDEWEFDYGIDTYSMQYASKETVDVPAGPFTDCYKVIARHNDEHYLTYWYKPGTGIVKYHYLDSEQILELKSFTLN